MITDEQRREVVANMRGYDVSEFKASAIVPFLDCLGVGYLDWRGILDSLADLIDRGECENAYDGSVQGSCDNGFLCSVCGCTVEDEEHYHVSGTWNWCPQCGKRVWTKKNG